MTDRAERPGAAADDQGQSKGAVGALGTVIFRCGGQVHRLEHYPEETLLETARRGGVHLNYNCERGECGTCMVTILSGKVRMRANEVLSEDDIRDGLALGCQSVPITDVVEVELP